MNSLEIIEQRISEAIEEVKKSCDSSVERQAELITGRCKIQGLTEDMIIEGENPRRIAELWLHSKLKAFSAKSNIQEAYEGSYPLLPYSKVIFDNIKNGQADTWTFPITLSVAREKVEIGKLQKAIEMALNAHPVFNTRIDDNGLQHYNKNYRTPYFSYKITEAETEVLLHIKANRILGDATSFGILLCDISKAYNGESLGKDSYWEYIKQIDAKRSTPQYKVHKEWVENLVDVENLNTAPNPDVPFARTIESHLAIESLSLMDLQDSIVRVCKASKVSLNIFLSLATSLAIMDYNDTNVAALTWAYSGRENLQQQHIFGSLHRDIPFFISRKAESRPCELLLQAKEQTELGIIHSEYPFTFLTERRDLWKNAVNVLLQPDFSGGFSQCTIPFEIVPEETDTPQQAYCMLDVEVNETPLMITLKYSSAHYKEASIAHFVNLIRTNVEWLLNSK